MPEATIIESTASSLDDLRKKLVLLSKDLADAEGEKKSVNKQFNDRIKDLKDEIAMTLELIREQEHDDA